MEQCYAFLDEFEVCGIIDEKTEKEHLTLTHLPSKAKTSVDCFHTVIGQLKTSEDGIIYKSTEGKPPQLDLASKQAGVFGIAQFFSENGLDAFTIQHSIEDMTAITPWSQALLPFVAKYNHTALKLHVDRAIESCVFEGKFHRPCLIASLLPFKNVLSKVVDEETLKALPSDFFDDKVRKAIAEDHHTSFENYKDLFMDKSWSVREAIAGNPSAAKVDEYRILFTDDDVLRRVAFNPEATRFPEFKNLFKHKNKNVRYLAIINQNATKIPEFKSLFKSTNSYTRCNVAENPNATDFDEYKELFMDKYPYVRHYAARNPNAVKFSEYKTLFTNKDGIVRLGIALNPNAVTFPEYKTLFTDDDKDIQKYACEQLKEYQRIHHTKKRFGCP